MAEIVVTYSFDDERLLAAAQRMHNERDDDMTPVETIRDELLEGWADELANAALLFGLDGFARAASEIRA